MGEFDWVDDIIGKQYQDYVIFGYYTNNAEEVYNKLKSMEGQKVVVDINIIHYEHYHLEYVIPGRLKKVTYSPSRNDPKTGIIEMEIENPYFGGITTLLFGVFGEEHKTFISIKNRYMNETVIRRSNVYEKWHAGVDSFGV